ncbi:MAG: lipo-like protein, partial [Bradyrhizobium sp.]
ISPYFEIVKPTIVHGFDYTALHWADRQKPLPEVAGEFGVFPEALCAPPLVPQEIDQEAPLAAEEVMPPEHQPVLVKHAAVEQFELEPATPGNPKRELAA